MESRFTRAEVVQSDAEARTIDMRIASYNTVDSFGTVWLPGCFDETLQRGYLPLAYSHSWSDPIGHMVEDLGDDEHGRVVRFALDDFDAVPRSRQVYAQLKSGTLKDGSIGFSGWVRSEPTPEDLQTFPGASDMVHKVELDEYSVVLRGAVPQAELVGIRNLQDLKAIIADAEIKDAEEIEVVDYRDTESAVDEAMRRIGLYRELPESE